MTRAHRISNLAGVVVPLLAVLVAIVLLWNTLVDWSDLAVLAVMYVIAGIAITAGLGYLIDGTLAAALTGALWGGLVRIFLLHHVTWSINSVCHFFGTRRFDVEDHSTNVFWLAPLSLGESWHHNHHAFPRSAFHGLRFWERLADPTGLLIALLEKLGLVWNVVRVSPERQRAKALPGQAAGAET